MPSDAEVSARGKEPTPAHVNRVAVKPPPFWKAEPRVWFVQLEAQFQLAGINTDETKFNYIVSAVDTDVLTQVADVVTAPPAKDKYNTLKEKLINIFSDSSEQRLRRLLSGVELGDKKPSQLLAEMKQLGGAAVTEELLKTLWLQRLPTHMQSVLAVSCDALPKIATMADKIAEIDQPRTFAVSSNEDSDLLSTVRQLVHEVAELKLSREQNSRHQFKSQRRHRSRSRTPARTSAHQMCWYHHHFREDARKCQQPCNFNSSAGAKSENTPPRHH